MKKQIVKNLADIPHLQSQQPEKPKSYPFYQPKQKEIVAGGDLDWKPINLIAAKMLMTSPWYCKPPEPEPIKTMKPEFENNNPRVNSKLIRGETFFDAKGLEPIAQEAHEKDMKKTLKELESLEIRAQELHDSIQYLLRNFQEPFEKCNELISHQLMTLREKRFGIDAESRTLMNQLKEVRQFFLDDDYEVEIGRLSEFVGLCNQLRELKENGFLDIIADTILKLSK